MLHVVWQGNGLNATWKKHTAQWDDVISVTMTTPLPDSLRFTLVLIKCSLWEHSLFYLYETWTAQVSCRDLNCNKCWQIRSDSSRLYDSGVTHSHLRRRRLHSSTERSSWLSLFSCPQALYLYTMTRGQLMTPQYEVPYLREQAVIFSAISHLSFLSHFW